MSSLFREEALRTAARSGLGDPLWDPVGSLGWYLQIASGLAVLGVLGILLLPIPYYQDFPAYARPSSVNDILKSDRSAVVEAVLVSPGERVEAGQPLIRLRPYGSLPSNQALLQRERSALLSQRAAVEAAADAERRRISALRQSSELLEKAIRAAQQADRRVMERFENQEKLAVLQAKRDDELLVNGFISAATASTNAVSRLTQLDAARSQVSDTFDRRRAELGDLLRTKIEISASERRLQELELRLSETEVGLLRVSVAEETIVSAPRSATVVQVFKGKGQPVDSTEPLIHLAGAESRQEVEVYVHPDRIGKIHKGDHIVIAPASRAFNPKEPPPLPVRATLTFVGTSAVPSSSIGVPITLPTLIVMARAAPQEDVTIGQPLRARVHLGSWSLIEWFLAQFRSFPS